MSFISANAKLKSDIAFLARKCPLGEVITNSDLNSVPGFDLSKHDSLWWRVRRSLAKSEGLCFIYEKGIGYRRIEHKDARILVKKTKSKIGRAAEHTGSVIDRIAYKSNSLSDDEKLILLRERNVLGTIKHLISVKEPFPVNQNDAKKPLSAKESATAFYQMMNKA